MLLSIQLNSNRPENIKALIDNIDETAANHSDIEVIININEGDENCKNIITSLQATTKVKLHYIQTNIIKSYQDLWKPLNQILKLTDSSAYFITNFSDEFRFKTKNWDDVIRKYIGYYEDGIFRIRLSRYRYYSYQDFWECIFAPDSLAFYTKKWLDIVGIWCPCLGPDSWQELVSYYLKHNRKFSYIQYNRDVIEPFLQFEGEGPGLGLNKIQLRQRIKNNVELFFQTTSHQMQEKAKHSSCKLLANILVSSYGNNLVATTKPDAFKNKTLSEISFKDNYKRKRIEFFYHGKIFYKLDYKLNKLRFFFINNFRKLNFAYYVGDLEKFFDKDIISNLNVYFRIKTHGSSYNIQKPEFLKRKKISILWPLIKPFLLISKNLKF